MAHDATAGTAGPDGPSASPGRAPRLGDGAIDDVLVSDRVLAEAAAQRAVMTGALRRGLIAALGRSPGRTPRPEDVPADPPAADAGRAIATNGVRSPV